MQAEPWPVVPPSVTRPVLSLPDLFLCIAIPDPFALQFELQEEQALLLDPKLSTSLLGELPQAIAAQVQSCNTFLFSRRLPWHPAHLDAAPLGAGVTAGAS